MLSLIRDLYNRIGKLRDEIDNNVDYLESVVQPIFDAIWNGRYTPGIEVEVDNEYVIISYFFRDEKDGEFLIPNAIFESDDPVQAAKEWGEEQRNKRKVEQRAMRIESLQREIESLKKSL